MEQLPEQHNFGLWKFARWRRLCRRHIGLRRQEPQGTQSCAFGLQSVLQRVAQGSFTSFYSFAMIPIVNPFLNLDLIFSEHAVQTPGDSATGCCIQRPSRPRRVHLSRRSKCPSTFAKQLSQDRRSTQGVRSNAASRPDRQRRGELLNFLTHKLIKTCNKHRNTFKARGFESPRLASQIW